MPRVERVKRAARLSDKAHKEPRATAAARSTPKTGDLKIRVFTKVGDQQLPVKDAKVTVKGQSKRTPASGEVAFNDVPAGSGIVLVRHACFPDWREKRAVAKGGTTEIAVELVRISLKQAAEMRGMQIGARQGERAPGEWHSAVYGTFWNSRSPDFDPATDAGNGPTFDNRPVVDQKNLDLIQYRFSDDVANTTKDIPGFRLQGTPLVWPAPNNSPGDPGKPDAPNATCFWKDRGWPGEYLRRHAKKNGKPDKELIRKTIDDIHGRFIRTLMQHDAQVYGGRTREWVVVNEVLNLKFKSSARKHGFWGKYYGVWEKDKKQIYNHVLEAFKAAHAADPDAVLILNDYNVEGVDPDEARPAKPHPDKVGSPRGFGNAYYYYWKPRMFRALAVWLQKKLKRVMGRVGVKQKFAVGFQMHIPIERRKKRNLAWMIYENVKWFRRKGIKVYVTEIDVMGPEAKMRKIYRNLFAALVLGGCRSIHTWGMFDYTEAGKLHRCMFSETEGCKEVGPPYRKSSYYGAVTGILQARQLRDEIKKDS